jgi:hypothetical protein
MRKFLGRKIYRGVTVGMLIAALAVVGAAAWVAAFIIWSGDITAQAIPGETPLALTFQHAQCFKQSGTGTIDACTQAPGGGVHMAISGISDNAAGGNPTAVLVNLGVINASPDTYVCLDSFTYTSTSGVVVTPPVEPWYLAHGTNKDLSYLLDFSSIQPGQSVSIPDIAATFVNCADPE